MDTEKKDPAGRAGRQTFGGTERVFCCPSKDSTGSTNCQGLDAISLAVKLRSVYGHRREFWQRFYKLPDPLKSEQDWLRYLHEDLTSMSETDLSREQRLVRLALDVGGDACDSWLAERQDAVLDEVQRRRKATVTVLPATGKTWKQPPTLLDKRRAEGTTRLNALRGGK